MRYTQTRFRKKKHRITIKNSRKNKLHGGKTHADPIPKIVHQIWFGGGEIAGWRDYLFKKNEEICRNNGYEYRLWLESDRTEDNFPHTFKIQQNCLKKGKTRLAQVADLGRIEIIYKFGGIYIDSIIELSPLLLEEIQILSGEGFDYNFIAANEDPCGLYCIGNGRRHYLSNSFFAAKPKSIILKRLLSPEKLNSIDINEPLVNRTTGPYYLREGIKNPYEEKVYLYKYDMIYVFPMSGSEAREGEAKKNYCLKDINEPDNPGEETIPVNNKKKLIRYCLEKEHNDIQDKIRNILHLKRQAAAILKEIDILEENDGNTIHRAIYQVGLGGTWSPD